MNVIGIPRLSRGKLPSVERSLIKLVLMGLALLVLADDGWAESWVFRRSYHSHQPTREVEIAPASPHTPINTRPQGAYVRGGYRVLRVGGNNLRSDNDRHYIFEGWIQRGEQY